MDQAQKVEAAGEQSAAFLLQERKMPASLPKGKWLRRKWRNVPESAKRQCGRRNTLPRTAQDRKRIRGIVNRVNAPASHRGTAQTRGNMNGNDAKEQAANAAHVHAVERPRRKRW